MLIFCRGVESISIEMNNNRSNQFFFESNPAGLGQVQKVDSKKCISIKIVILIEILFCFGVTQWMINFGIGFVAMVKFMDGFVKE